MSAQTVIDGLEFCRAGKELRGRLPVTVLGRLQDCLYGTDGEVAFQVTGGSDARMRPVLRLEVSGMLELQCQRCLERLDYRLGIATTLVLLRENEKPPVEADEPDAPDCIEADAEMDVATLVEEEILLSLPLSPRHPEGSCAARSRAVPPRGSASPFDRLAGLKK